MLQLSTPQPAYPTAYQTVDIAIMTRSLQHILLGKKEGNGLLQFIGGFSDPKSKSLEEDAIRETKEETGLIIKNPIYIGSHIIDDERYRNSVHKIKTALFLAKLDWSQFATANDDIEAVYWMPIKSSWKGILVKKHHVLMNMLLNALTNPDRLW